MPHSFELEALAAAPKAVLLIVHGLAEYATRYRAIADELAARGISTFSFDQRGHGAHAGVQTHVDRFKDFVADAAVVCDQLASRYPAVPLQTERSRVIPDCDMRFTTSARLRGQCS